MNYHDFTEFYVTLATTFGPSLGVLALLMTRLEIIHSK